MQCGKLDDDSQIMVALRPMTNAWLKRDESSSDTLLGSSFVKPATEQSSRLLALHMFDNHLYVLVGVLDRQPTTGSTRSR
jgi:hypothetical protein